MRKEIGKIRYKFYLMDIPVSKIYSEEPVTLIEKK
jgi:hypothetical protein